MLSIRMVDSGCWVARNDDICEAQTWVMLGYPALNQWGSPYFVANSMSDCSELIASNGWKSGDCLITQGKA
jgi:hypothetical protein